MTSANVGATPETWIESRAGGIAGTLTAMLGFALVAVLGVLTRPLLPIDETRYLAVAWEMHLSGNWIVPHLNGEIYAHKPPLLFWLINLVWSVTGVSETAARLVGPTFGTAAIGATALLARRLRPADPAAGGRAALALAGLAVFTAYAGLTMFDAMLAFATVLGVLALTWARLTEARPSRAGWLGFGAALALGVLAKGPVILVHLLPVALLMPVWAEGSGWGRTLRGIGLAVATALVLLALWLVPALIQGGAEYRQAVLWTQSAGRVSGSFGHGRPWWFYLPLLPLMLWPWIWSLDVWRGLRGIAPRGPAPIWATATLVAFSLIGGKQPHYLLPALPATALIFGEILGARVLPLRARPAGLLPAALGVAALVAATGFGPGKVLAVDTPAWAVAGFAALCLGLGAAALMLRRHSIALLGLGLVAVLDLAFLGAQGRVYDSASVAARVAGHEAAGIGVTGDYQGEFNFAGRLRSPVAMFDDTAAAFAWLDAGSPDRVLVGKTGKRGSGREPEATVTFNGDPYGIWSPHTPQQLEGPSVP